VRGTVVSFSDHTLVQLFKRSHHGARGSLSTPLPLFLILVFLFSVCLLSLQGWKSMDWSLVPTGKRTFNFWPVSRGMKDVSMDGKAGTKARHKPRSGSAVHAPEVRSTSGIRECSERLVGNF
jgi:hypothetical protein